MCLLCRKILNDLSSPVNKMDDDSNSSQSQDGDHEAAQNLTSSASSVHYQQGDQPLLCLFHLDLCDLFPFCFLFWVGVGGGGSGYIFFRYVWWSANERAYWLVFVWLFIVTTVSFFSLTKWELRSQFKGCMMASSIDLYTFMPVLTS